MFKKICSRCGARLNPGEKCHCLANRIREKQRQKKYDKEVRSPEARKFYASRIWHETRGRVKDRAGGLDEWLLNKGIVEAGKMVHHIIPRSEDGKRILDVRNLILVSPRTHAYIHARYDESLASKKAMQKELFNIVKKRNKHWES